MKVQFKKLDPRAYLPTYANFGDAGLDLYALEDFVLYANRSTFAKTGISVAIPAGHVGLLCSRSGLASKCGVQVTNAPGIIDAGYRGELGVLLSYNGQESMDPSRPRQVIFGTQDVHPFLRFKAGERIGQLVITPVAIVEPQEVVDLPESERGTGGFGSSGS